MLRVLDRALPLHAHSLAGRQRAEQERREAAERARFGSLDHETTLQGEAVREMADLIDKPGEAS